jgi:hypothetical protein
VSRRGIDTTLGQTGYCARCAHVVPEGPDRCIGILPRVSHACCDHDSTEAAYVAIGGEPDQDLTGVPDVVVLRGEDALAYFEAARD